MIACHRCKTRLGEYSADIDHLEPQSDGDITVRTEQVWYCWDCMLDLRAAAHFDLWQTREYD